MTKNIPKMELSQKHNQHFSRELKISATVFSFLLIFSIPQSHIYRLTHSLAQPISLMNSFFFCSHFLLSQTHYHQNSLQLLKWHLSFISWLSSQLNVMYCLKLLPTISIKLLSGSSPIVFFFNSTEISVTFSQSQLSSLFLLPVD